MTISYTTEPDAHPETIQNHPAIRTKQGGLIIVDKIILDLWKHAQGQLFDTIISDRANQAVPSLYIRAALACLAEAQLLTRSNSFSNKDNQEHSSSSFVSVIIVSHNSRRWLESCIPSIFSQTRSRMEIILIDNASSDETSSWVQQQYPQIKLILLSHKHSFANALNTGVSQAAGDYYLLLNPDTELTRFALSELLHVAEISPMCAAVAAKLKLSWAPAFLNGLGNFVGAVSWGTDLGLGQLDLGQFDHWGEVPSACFAAALITKKAYEDVGPFDEKFPLYYEDSEWCYRARLFGYQIHAAPKAVVYHAFGGSKMESEGEISPQKIRQVVYGRLRFITRILTLPYFIYFAFFYILEDMFNFLASFFRGKWGNIQSYFGAYAKFISALPEIIKERHLIQSHRKISLSELLHFQRDLPMTVIWHGLPLLTWDIVCHHYLPLILSGKTRSLPEFEGIDLNEITLEDNQNLISKIKRARQIWKVEGFSMLIHRIGRTLQRLFNQI